MCTSKGATPRRAAGWGGGGGREKPRPPLLAGGCSAWKRLKPRVTTGQTEVRGRSSGAPEAGSRSALALAGSAHLQPRLPPARSGCGCPLRLLRHPQGQLLLRAVCFQRCPRPAWPPGLRGPPPGALWVLVTVQMERPCRGLGEVWHGFPGWIYLLFLVGFCGHPLVPQRAGYRVQGLVTGAPQLVWGYEDRCLLPDLPQPLAGAHRSQPEVREKQNASPAGRESGRAPSAGQGHQEQRRPCCVPARPGRSE